MCALSSSSSVDMIQFSSLILSVLLMFLAGTMSLKRAAEMGSSSYLFCNNLKSANTGREIFHITSAIGFLITRDAV